MEDGELDDGEKTEGKERWMDEKRDEGMLKKMEEHHNIRRWDIRTVRMIVNNDGWKERQPEGRRGDGRSINEGEMEGWRSNKCGCRRREGMTSEKERDGGEDGGQERWTDVKEDGGNSLLRAATANQLSLSLSHTHTHTHNFNSYTVT